MQNWLSLLGEKSYICVDLDDYLIICYFSFLCVDGYRSIFMII